MFAFGTSERAHADLMQWAYQTSTNWGARLASAEADWPGSAPKQPQQSAEAASGATRELMPGRYSDIL